MKLIILYINLIIVTIIGFSSCSKQQVAEDRTAAEIINNPNYPAMSFGGYRKLSRDTVPSVSDLKEDVRILSAMGIKLIRLYDTQLGQTPNLLQAISELKKEDKSLELYVMLGAWIEAENSRTDSVHHDKENVVGNTAEIEKAVEYTNKYPDIVKCIAVGNEAMVHWAASYNVTQDIILKWVKYLQALKQENKLPKDVWITCSDNFASWGGGDSSYHTDLLKELYQSVDFISVHTYPFHDTFYNPSYWHIPLEEANLDSIVQIDRAMERAVAYTKTQYLSVVNYMRSIGFNKPVIIGETGWATLDGAYSASANASVDINLNIQKVINQEQTMYGLNGSKAADEYKEKLYYDRLREWTSQDSITCFYFEIFDEPWKDYKHPNGTENHFGLIDIDGHAKYALWNLVDDGTFNGLTRNGKAITKSFNGNRELLMKGVLPPPISTNK
ncbi:MAG: glycosyl hydrolase family 17 [Bacteroidia bacterium]|nr:glycosyl hydrolase family 17 [Bacteroidia bacterium]